MKVRLDAGRLARLLGHAETFAAAPGDLDDLVVATLDVSNFLLSGDSADGEGYTNAFGNSGLVFRSYENPAAGAEIFISVPTGEVWRVHVFRARLVTSAAVATRYGDLRLTQDPSTVPPSTDYYRDGIVSGQAASLTGDYVWARGHGAVVNNTGNQRQVRPFPDILMPPLHRITTFTLNIQAGDQWSLAALLYERARA